MGLSNDLAKQSSQFFYPIMIIDYQRKSPTQPPEPDG